MGPNYRCFRDFQCLIDGSFGAVGKIDQDTKPIALGDDPLAELGQAIVLGTFGLEISNRISREMYQLNMPNAEFIGRLHARNIVFQKEAAFRRQDHMRDARKCCRHVVRVLDCFQLLSRDMLLDAGQFPLKPPETFSRRWNRLLDKSEWASGDPKRIGPERPGHQGGVSFGHDWSQRPRFAALQPDKPQVTMHVGKIDRVFGKRVVRDAKRNSERGLFKKYSTIEFN